jgi:FeS assembly protein IscX
MFDDSNPLYWENTYEIVLTLMRMYPEVDVEMVGVEQLRQWVITLPNFSDEPEMVTEQILQDILREWYEEISFNE